MTINLMQATTEAKARNINGISPYDILSGFWGTVTKVYSELNSVDVMSNFQVEFKYVPVSSRTWVNTGKTQLYSKDWTSAERDLPPIGSVVFVLMPNGNSDSAFVLCSGFFRGEPDMHTLYATSAQDKSEKDAQKEVVTCGGWHIKEDYADGKIEVENFQKNVSLKIINPSDSQKNEIQAKVFGSTISINKDGITINSSGQISLTTGNNSSLSVTANDNLSVTVNNNKGVSISAKTVDVKADKMTVNNTGGTAMFQVGN